MKLDELINLNEGSQGMIKIVKLKDIIIGFLKVLYQTMKQVTIIMTQRGGGIFRSINTETIIKKCIGEK